MRGAGRALREIYDGYWARHVGTDGGRTLAWRGRLVVVGAVTSAWDSAYQAVSLMGDRFVLARLRSADHRRAAGRQAMSNSGAEAAMREELAESVAKLLAGETRAPLVLSDAETDRLLGLADIVTRARTGTGR